MGEPDTSDEMIVNNVAQLGAVAHQMVRFTCDCGTHVATETGSDTDMAQRCHRCRLRDARRGPAESLTRPPTS